MKKPSLTELINLLDKPALMRWANQQGLKGIDIDKDRGRRLSAGTSNHKQIENFIRLGEPMINADHQKSLVEYLKEKEILGMENKIETDIYRTVNAKLKFKDEIYLVDFKTGAKKIYFENKLQLIGYGMAEQCDCFSIVSVPDFTIMSIKIYDRKPYEDILKSLSLIYTAKQEIENGKLSQPSL